ncbi:unnamed protein product [Cuscuta epithymum]|uniref:CCHC-type domain-containing protein n=1 Tax=Cuscuta epithymum TaxID=186058 RepID=A0AAV0D5T3_9ASTE|nr:unnamed protein product [Cuscuta epithymum]
MIYCYPPGKPIRIDTPTTNFSRPSTARICIEIYISKDPPPPPPPIWIGNGANGFYQTIQYDKIPKFCHSCSQIGHSLTECPRTIQTLAPKAVLVTDDAPVYVSTTKPIIDHIVSGACDETLVTPDTDFVGRVDKINNSGLVVTNYASAFAEDNSTSVVCVATDDVSNDASPITDLLLMK